jgi:hypothetical protein
VIPGTVVTHSCRKLGDSIPSRSAVDFYLRYDAKMKVETILFLPMDTAVRAGCSPCTFVRRRG